MYIYINDASICIYKNIYIYIYVYIYREKERETLQFLKGELKDPGSLGDSKTISTKHLKCTGTCKLSTLVLTPRGECQVILRPREPNRTEPTT